MLCFRDRLSRVAIGVAPLVGAALMAGVCGVSILGCDDDALAPQVVDAGAAPFGLTPEQAAAVLAKVGDRTITLGDYALTLERMGDFDRARYQSKEGRKNLLKEMIHNELLAQEARRRGLDKHPEVQDAMRQILRDAMLGKIHDAVRPPGEIPSAEVRAYYDNNQDEFKEPERRRVSAIVLGDPTKAAEVLAEAVAITDDAAWGELFFKHSLTAPKQRNPDDPADLAGDLGLVSPPGDPKGANTKVPKGVRKVVFDMHAVGDIHNEVIEQGQRFYIVRLAGISKGHTRTFEMSERSIRIKLYQRAQRAAEAAAATELKKKLKITIDEDAIKEVELPAALKDYKPLWDESVAPAPSGSASK